MITAAAAQMAGEEAYELGVNNERDGQGGYRPNKIIFGMWLLEQLLPHFSTRPSSDAEWSALIEQAEEQDAPDILIDRNDKTLFSPADMKEAIDANIRTQGGTPPTTLPGYMRLICDSLASFVDNTLDSFSRITQESFDNIAIVGGGSKNRLLCQRIADTTGLPVTSYALEGTAVGNIGYQLLAMGAIDNLDVFRAKIAEGISKQVYRPSGA